jgi:hypothetical protein
MGALGVNKIILKLTSKEQGMEDRTLIRIGSNGGIF